MAEEERVKYQAEVSFVGSLYEDKHQYDKVVLSDYLRGYLDGIIEAQSYIYGYNFLESMLSDKMVEEFCSAASWCGFGDDYKVLPKEVISTEFLGRKCAEIERFRCVSKLAEYFSLDLYTLSDTSSIPHVNNKGPADSRVEMPKIFKASKINLNMTIKTIETGIPQRIFDIMGCGGFVITNYQSEIMDYFVPGEDLVVYESLEDLISKVDYYLKHEEQRQKIAETGYRKVKSLYTVESRLKEIIEIVWQDRLHSYGVSHPKSKEKYIAIKELISKLEFDCILDVGVYLSRYSGIDSCESESLIEHQHIDGVDLIHYMKNEVGANLYQKLYETGKVTDQYSIVLLIEILKYFNKEEQIALLERFSQVSNLLLLDYDEGYLDIVKQNPYWKEEVIQINQCKLLLVTII
jgi:spore maturation protein CgeB